MNRLAEPPSVAVHPHAAARVGLAYGLAAYLWWGFIALYFKLVSQVPPIQILAHRIVWSLLLVLLLPVARGGWSELATALRQRRTLLMLTASTIMLSINWFTFIFAVASGRLVEASLGYFINPLVSVLLGMIFLRERLRRWQAVGLLLAAAGVAYLAWARGQPPWLSLILAGSFGLYALLRKTAPVGSMAGLTIETAILFVPALLIIGLRQSSQQPPYDLATYGTLMLAGIVTAVPLLMFASAARRLRLATIGFIQYLTPTCQFLLAVLAFGEPFAGAELLSFGLIWAALLVYSWDSYRAYRGGLALLPPVPVEP